MPTYTFDVGNPESTDAVSGFPTNEQAFRAMVDAVIDIEHDSGEGRHQFGRGLNATRDAITTWGDGAIWFSTDTVTGETILTVYNGAAWINTDYGILDVSQSWTAIQSATYATMGITGAALDLDWSDGHYQKYTMTGNLTLGAGTNKPASGEGASIVLELTQDGTGSRTLAYNAEYLFAFGLQPTLTTAAASVDLLNLTLLSSGSVLVTPVLDVS